MIQYWPLDAQPETLFTLFCESNFCKAWDSGWLKPIVKYMDRIHPKVSAFDSTLIAVLILNPQLKTNPNGAYNLIRVYLLKSYKTGTDSLLDDIVEALIKRNRLISTIRVRYEDIWMHSSCKECRHLPRGQQCVRMVQVQPCVIPEELQNGGVIPYSEPEIAMKSQVSHFMLLKVCA